MGSDWSIPAAVFGNVAVFHCDLGDASPMAIDRVGRWLAPDEVARARAFRVSRDADRFIRGRGFLRAILAAHLGVSPAAIGLRRTPRGKPHLAGMGPAFSLSRAGDQAVLAVSSSQAVGVDIEVGHRLPEDTASMRDLVRACCLPSEIEAIEAAADFRRAFLRFWTAKEARMKLTGEGLSLDPRMILLRHDREWPTGYAAPESQGIELNFLAHPEAVVAVASGPIHLHLSA